MQCKVCAGSCSELFSAPILRKYDVPFYCCNDCGFVQCAEAHWLDEAYAQPINASDTGYMVRNVALSQRVAWFLRLYLGRSAVADDTCFLDYAGGYGVFVRMMRDIGLNFYHYDTYTENLFARGFSASMEDRYAAITAFEVFEHLPDPLSEIDILLAKTDLLIFSTERISRPPPALDDWWYYQWQHGQHISFYTTDTLRRIAERHGYHYVAYGMMQVMSRHPLPRWLRWAMKGVRYGLHKPWLRRMPSRTLADHQQACLGEGASS